MQVVVVTDGVLANTVLGRALSLDKALEPDLSDELLSIGGHRTMFSAGEASSGVIVCSTDTSHVCSLSCATGGYGSLFAVLAKEAMILDH